MKLTIKHIVAASAIAATGIAHAAPVHVSVGDTWNGLTASGTASLSFSSDLLTAMDTGKISIDNYGVATSTIVKDADGYFLSASAAAPLTSATFDDVSLEALAVASSGGVTLTAPAMRGISTGGSLVVTDLAADLVTKKIYATVIGGNGVGTLTNFALWDFATITGTIKFAGPGVYNNTISGLSLSTASFDVFAQSLGLLKTGKDAMRGITDYGTVTSQIIGAPVPTPAIPEPSTYALMGLGLVGVMMATRRKLAQAA